MMFGDTMQILYISQLNFSFFVQREKKGGKKLCRDYALVSKRYRRLIERRRVVFNQRESYHLTIRTYIYIYVH